ncbi:MAG: CAP domain-containing protein [Myxococcota bacterium]
MFLLLLSSVFVAQAGVGDPVDGHPSWLERDLHLWTNAARMAPHDFAKDAQDGGCDVDDWAKAGRVPPLRYNLSLARVARTHSADMHLTGELSHDSSDGRTMIERIQAAYGSDKAFGENVARGYPTARMAVLSGWMCSDGHRVNLLHSRYDEVGHGAVERWFTQDFGDGGGQPNPINSAVHEPEQPVDRVTFWSDTWSGVGATPDAVDVVLDGRVVTLAQVAGVGGGGLWTGDAAVDGRCSPWFVEAQWADRTVRWPESGSYAMGDCLFDDPGAGWLATQVERGAGPFDPDWLDPDAGTDGTDGTDDTDPPSGGRRLTHLCAAQPGPLTGLGALLVLGLIRRRRAPARPATRTARRAEPQKPPRH